MNTISALEIKRRGISIIDEQIACGPVHVTKNNRPQYVVMTEDGYQHLMYALEWTPAFMKAAKRFLQATPELKQKTSYQVIGLASEISRMLTGLITHLKKSK